MALIWLLGFVLSPAGHVLSRWWGLRVPTKFATGASVVVIGGMAYLGFVITAQIRENIIHQSAAAAALYMYSFVERHVQELAAKPTLSEENRQALEKLLSPASIHRPVVAFRIWQGDTVAFSNERELIGTTYPRTASREHAWQGQMAVEFEQPDGDDDRQVRSLELPLLEVYAPVREQGTGRIIALVETYEVAVELKREVWLSQLIAWAAIVTAALVIIWLLFSLAGARSIENKRFVDRIAELSRLRAQSEHRRRTISLANLHLSEKNERSLRRIANELNVGPIQFLALALVKFQALDELASRAKAAVPLQADQLAEDLAAIYKALNDALHHIRGVASSLLPADIEDLSVSETFAKAARHHERQTGAAVKFEAHGLPTSLPFPVKVGLYYFTLEGLASTSATSNVQAQSISASWGDDRLVLEIAGGDGTLCDHPQSPSRLATLRNRIEAIGGKLSSCPTPAGGLSLIAELCFSDVELDGS